MDEQIEKMYDELKDNIFDLGENQKILHENQVYLFNLLTEIPNLPDTVMFATKLKAFEERLQGMESYLSDKLKDMGTRKVDKQSLHYKYNYIDNEESKESEREQ